MIIYDPNTNEKVVFSESAMDIKVTDIQSKSITVGLTQPSGARRDMTLYPNANREVTLDIRSIFKALSPASPFQINRNHEFVRFVQIPTVSIHITDGLQEQDYTKNVIVGGIQNSAFVLNRQFLTWKAEDAKYDRRGFPYVFALCYKGLRSFWPNDTKARVMVKAYFTNGTSKISSYDFSLPQYNPFGMCINLPLKSGNLKAMDVWVEFVNESGFKAETIIGPQRFRIARPDGSAKCFVFRNTLGALDSVYSHGDETVTIEQEFSTFVNRTVEQESSNDWSEKHSVNSGYISTARDATLWEDFLKSSERYLYEDGSLKGIVLDESNFERTKGKLSNVNFVYRESKKPVCHNFQKNNLIPYDYDEQ